LQPSLNTKRHEEQREGRGGRKEEGWTVEIPSIFPDYIRRTLSIGKEWLYFYRFIS